jgi:ATP-dependent 26S proteasome regulatory subunit
LLEALAKTTSVPLIELSPSDIAVAGQEAIESRARAIFQALSLLTKVVIIFDEFEPVLLSRRRNKGETESDDRSIFTFLTPGMLPKLTRLHQAAEEQRFVYYLVTNHYEKLDEAAIREGRFDRHIGIYNPDPLSRAGAFRFKLLDAVKRFSPKQKKAFETVVKAASGVSAVRLAKKWFKVDTAQGPWAYVCSGHGWEPPKPVLPTVESSSHPEEQWLAVWETDLQDDTRELADVLKKPRRTWR